MKEKTEKSLFEPHINEEGKKAMIGLAKEVIEQIEKGRVVSLDFIVIDPDGDPISAHCSMGGVPKTLVIGAYEAAKHAYVERVKMQRPDAMDDIFNAIFSDIVQQGKPVNENLN
jgi:hypothetical protein